MLAAEKKNYTDQDYMMLEEGAPFQLIHHDLINSVAIHKRFHQRISFKLSLIIGAYFNDINNTGEWLFAPMDVKLDDGNIYQPDIYYFGSKKRGTDKSPY